MAANAAAIGHSGRGGPREVPSFLIEGRSRK
jgi:hypothetical protein